MSKHAKKKREEEEKKAKHEQQKQKLLDKKRRERNARMTEKVQKIRQLDGFKSITNMQGFVRQGYTVISEEISSGEHSYIFRAKMGNNDSIVVKITILGDSCPPTYKENAISESSKIQRFISDSIPRDRRSLLRHPFVNVFDIFVINDNEMYVFMDECQKLSLDMKIKAKHTITEDNAKVWAKILALGINTMHTYGVAHRNIRPENVIFNISNKIRLVGMNMCTLFWDSQNQTVIAQDKVVTPSEHDTEGWKKLDHLPPEAFKHQFDPSLADIWSWGVLVCSLINKQTPFDMRDIAYDKQSSIEDQWKYYKEKHQTMTNEAKRFFDGLFVEDVTKRITLLDALKKPWLLEAKIKVSGGSV